MSPPTMCRDRRRRFPPDRCSRPRPAGACRAGERSEPGRHADLMPPVARHGLIADPVPLAHPTKVEGPAKALTHVNAPIHNIAKLGNPVHWHLAILAGPRQVLRRRRGELGLKCIEARADLVHELPYPGCYSAHYDFATGRDVARRVALSVVSASLSTPSTILG